MSSVALRASENFIRLLFETDKKQGKVLLTTATPVQVNALTEISFNLLHRDIPNKFKRIVKKTKKVLTKLAKVTGSVKSKLALIKKNAESIYKLLIAIKDSILELL